MIIDLKPKSQYKVELEVLEEKYHSLKDELATIKKLLDTTVTSLQVLQSFRQEENKKWDMLAQCVLELQNYSAIPPSISYNIF